MSVLLFAFETHPGGCNVFIGMYQSLRMPSKDACALDFIVFFVTNNHLPLVFERNVASNPFIEPIFREIGMISLYIISKSILCTRVMARL